MVNKKVLVIKLVHSILFLIMVFCIFYILYCAITARYDWTLVAATAMILAEGIALIINRWQCPLTTLAKKYGDEKGTVTDIFLPAWLVPHTFKIFTVIFAAEVVWLSFGYFLR